MSTFLTIIIVISAILIVFAVIMQPSKDGGLGGLASGGVTDSVFGTNRNEFLAKTTWWLMAIFLISSIVLAKHRTTEHEENEAEINTRSDIEEMSDTKPVKSIIENTEKKIDDVKADAESKADDVKADADDVKADAESKADDVKADAEKKADDVKADAEKKADDVKADAEKKADDVKADAEKKIDDTLKNVLPKSE